MPLNIFTVNKGIQTICLHQELLHVPWLLWNCKNTLEKFSQRNWKTLLSVNWHSPPLQTATMVSRFLPVYSPPFFWDRVSSGPALLLHQFHFQVIVRKVSEFLHQSCVSTSQLWHQELLQVQGFHRVIRLRLRNPGKDEARVVWRKKEKRKRQAE